jgi:hypothetical protein
MKSNSAFRIIPLASEFVDRIRCTMTDDFGHSLRVTTSTDRNPCRFTLQLTSPGEELILLSYSPFNRDHPYREIGPIFIRRQGDVGYTDLNRFPPELDPTKRVFRAYNLAEEIVDARVGTTEPEALIDELFRNSAVNCIHVRSLTHGCFTFKIERA